MILKKVFKFIYFLLLLPLVILLRLLSFFYLIRFAFLHSPRVGHFVGITSLYLCERYNKINIPKKKHSDFFFLHNKIANKQIAKLFSRKLNILPKFLRPLMELNNLIPGGKIHDIYYRENELESIATWRHRDVHNLLDKTPAQVSFTSEEIKNAESQLESLEIKRNDKIVLLLVRDEGYLKKNHPDHGSVISNKPKIQNALINSYLKAIKNLIDKGIKVIRIGTDHENFLQYENANFIDLFKLKKWSPLLETYLNYKCEFVLGTFSGGCITPFWLFRKPTIFTNHVPVGHFHTNSEKILITFKMHYLKKENRFLKLSEIFDNQLAGSNHSDDYKNKGIELIDNTEEEIDLASQEMLKRINNDWTDDEETKILKNQFLNVYKKNIEKYNHFKGLHGKIIIPTISSDFLKTHKKLIN